MTSEDHDFVHRSRPDVGLGAELTIDSGEITINRWSGNFYTVDTESDAASDDLDTINGTEAGLIYVFGAEHDDRSVVFKNGAGNLKLANIDFTLNHTNDRIILQSDGTSLFEWSRSNNG